MSLPFQTAVVTGTSRGFGRAIATALTAEGTRVVGVARGPQDAGFTTVAADAADESVADRLVREHRPDLLVLNAGAVPHMAPVHEQTWESFSRNWHTDVRQVFAWTRAALLAPLAPGSVVVIISSGAAIGGSPLSGGYASAKAAVRFLRAYGEDESARADLGIRFAALLPQLTPLGGVGAAGVTGYAARQGVPRETFVANLAPVLTPEQVAKAVVEIASTPDGAPELQVTATGTDPVPAFGR
jgi:NAD(P)-dependent dehydrogenase (short-subunit alcohol dehydrogenase family)